MSTVLKVYVRSGCHLCDDMLEGLKEYQQEHALTLEVIDIMGKPSLETEFGRRIPVLQHENDVICEYFLEPATLLDYISAIRN